jgi:MFS family permease
MVVILQVWVTSRTKRYSPPRMMALGALFYAVGVGSVALGAGFWGFWLCMVIATVGELIQTPTASTFVANLAPPDMRGRYMSIYGLAHSIAFGFGPLIGGLINDHVSPKATWVSGGIFSLVAAAGFLLMLRLDPIRLKAASQTLLPELQEDANERS